MIPVPLDPDSLVENTPYSGVMITKGVIEGLRLRNATVLDYIKQGNEWPPKETRECNQCSEPEDPCVMELLLDKLMPTHVRYKCPKCTMEIFVSIPISKKKEMEAKKKIRAQEKKEGKKKRSIKE